MVAVPTTQPRSSTVAGGISQVLILLTFAADAINLALPFGMVRSGSTVGCDLNKIAPHLLSSCKLKLCDSLIYASCNRSANGVFHSRLMPRGISYLGNFLPCKLIDDPTNSRLRVVGTRQNLKPRFIAEVSESHLRDLRPGLGEISQQLREIIGAMQKNGLQSRRFRKSQRVKPRQTIDGIVIFQGFHASLIH